MRSSTIVLSLLLLTSPVLLAESQSETEEPRPCLENFSEEGSFFKGKTYETWQEHEDLEYDSAFRTVAQTVAQEKWGQVDADKDLGIIAAGQEVTAGEGSVAPLNVIVKETDDEGIRIEANFSTAGMQKAKTKDVKEALCTIVEAPED